MNHPQLKLDFSRIHPAPVPEDGKKLKRIGMACSDEFKGFFELMVKARNSTESELTFEYVLRGIREDLGSLFMAQPHLDKTLREAINKFF